MRNLCITALLAAWPVAAGGAPEPAELVRWGMAQRPPCNAPASAAVRIEQLFLEAHPHIRLALGKRQVEDSPVVRIRNSDPGNDRARGPRS